MLAHALPRCVTRRGIARSDDSHGKSNMRSDSGQTQSIWMDTADVPEYPALAGDATTDVCVIGAGIAGMTTAYLLAKEGKKVLVVDDGPIAGGETCRTTAHLTNVWDDRFYHLEEMHGKHAARLTYESHTLAIDTIERIAREENIDCDFRRVDGWLFFAEQDRAREPDLLEKELEAARSIGHTVERVARPPIPGNDVGTALRFPNQGQFHPLRYVAGLASALGRFGATIHTRTHVEGVEGGPRPKVKTADGHTITCNAVCVCTNSPISDYVVIHVKEAPYRSFVIAGPVRAASVQPGLYWDTAAPYHYVRLMTGDGGEDDYLIVGGEDHKTGQKDDAEERFRCLEEWTRERFPSLGAVEYKWSGQIMEPAD